MEIIRAEETMLETVKDITQATIAAIYPRYYPQGAVDFFKRHHSDANILSDVRAGIVYLLRADGDFVGTVTIKENDICRLFVLPRHQGRGHGRRLLDFAEEEISRRYDVITLDASLPAKNIYLKRGYSETGYHIITTENGDCLCYDSMEKPV